MTTYTIAVLPGDGIGQEVTPEAVRVLQAVARRANLSLTFEQALCGGAAIDATGSPLPDASLAVCRRAEVGYAAAGAAAGARIAAAAQGPRSLRQSPAGHLLSHAR